MPAGGREQVLRALGGRIALTLVTSGGSPAFGGHPASIVPAAYSSVPKTGQNRRTSRSHLALRGTTWHYVAQGAPYMYAYMRVRRTSGIATSCHPAQLPREDRARPPGPGGANRSRPRRPRSPRARRGRRAASWPASAGPVRLRTPHPLFLQRTLVSRKRAKIGARAGPIWHYAALRGTTWHKAPPTCTRTCAFEGPLGSPRRAIQPSSREKTAHDLRVGELQWPPEDGENVTNRTVNAPSWTMPRACSARRAGI